MSEQYFVMPTHWDRDLVKAWLREAAETERTFPQVRAKGYGSFWPEIVHDANEAYAWQEATVNRLKPTKEQFAKYDFVSKWSALLEPHQLDVLWMSAYGRSCKVMMNKYHIGRTAINNRLNGAREFIASALNANINLDDFMQAKAKRAINA